MSTAATGVIQRASRPGSSIPVVPPETLLAATAAKTDQVAQRSLLGIAQGAMFVTSDISAFFRNGYSTINVISGRADPVGLSFLGITTCFNALTGAVSLWNSVKAYQTAQEIGDEEGRDRAFLNGWIATVQTVAGAMFIPARAVAIATYYTAAKTVSQAAMVLGTVGGSLFGVFGLLLTVFTTLDLYEQHQFKQELDGAEDKRGFLQEWQEKIGSQDHGGKRALAQLERLIGKEGVEKLKAGDVAGVQLAIDQQMIKSALLLAAAVLTVVAAALTTIFTGGVFFIIGMVLMTLGSLVWLPVDIPCLLNSFKKGEQGAAEGKYERFVLAFTTIALCAVTIAATLLSAGVAPMLICLAIGISLLAIKGYCIYRLKQRDAPEPQVIPLMYVPPPLPRGGEAARLSSDDSDDSLVPPSIDDPPVLATS